ncbi:DNA adenine methyltransferase [Nitrososphaeria virus YSH_462411]|uniref:DNA adenine methyltransferase n=1 Tax=Nitrososphaeria virus YSH_462411 TaxID=3071321 RepID=A0A976YEX9_9CAUD|nr:DNA adenine methyltransferase [Yangshan Harbor Nitrososphaeria virus]UVF62320.1 DNA adenine methyltransferase [Nitrososphaeria virus YSH_462411]
MFGVSESLSQLHNRKRSKASLSDEYETPDQLYYDLCDKYEVYPNVDICANINNYKVYVFVDKDIDALKIDWYEKFTGEDTFWCNPPHSLNEKFVRKAFEQWKKHNINIIMLLPCNTQSSKYWHECIEGVAEYHPIKGRIRFLVNGEPSKHLSRNAYCVVIWRKK